MTIFVPERAFANGTLSVRITSDAHVSAWFQLFLSRSDAGRRYYHLQHVETQLFVAADSGDIVHVSQIECGRERDYDWELVAVNDDHICPAMMLRSGSGTDSGERFMSARDRQVVVRGHGHAELRFHSPLRVMTYNLQLFSDNMPTMGSAATPKVSSGARVHILLNEQMPVLRKSSVIVFTEVFSKRHAKVIKKALRDAFPYQTGVLGSREECPDDVSWDTHETSWSTLLNGGVLIVSATPITRAVTKLFSGACHSDVCASKGLIHVALEHRESGRPVHVIGTHMEAWNSVEGSSIRAGQLRELVEYAVAQIPTDDIVILAGDLNVNHHSSAFADLQEITVMRVDYDQGNYKGSYDSEFNTYLRFQDIRPAETLDFVFPLGTHADLPNWTSTVLHPPTGFPYPLGYPIVKGFGMDASDHYPVIGYVASAASLAPQVTPNEAPAPAITCTGTTCGCRRSRCWARCSGAFSMRLDRGERCYTTVPKGYNLNRRYVACRKDIDCHFERPCAGPCTIFT